MIFDDIIGHEHIKSFENAGLKKQEYLDPLARTYFQIFEPVSYAAVSITVPKLDITAGIFPFTISKVTGLMRTTSKKPIYLL